MKTMHKFLAVVISAALAASTSRSTRMCTGSLLRVGKGIAVAIVQRNVCHAHGGHLAGGIGQAPPCLVLIFSA